MPFSLPPLITDSRLVRLPISERSVACLLAVEGWRIPHAKNGDPAPNPPKQVLTFLVDSLRDDPFLAYWALDAFFASNEARKTPALLDLARFLFESGDLPSGLHFEPKDVVKTDCEDQYQNDIAIKAALRRAFVSMPLAERSDLEEGDPTAQDELRLAAIQAGVRSWLPLLAPPSSDQSNDKELTEEQPLDAVQEAIFEKQTSLWGRPVEHLELMWEGRRQRILTTHSRRQHRLTEEKLAALGEFAAGLGHDFNNPLAIIHGRADILIREETRHERRRNLSVILAQTRRAFEMIADIRLFSRPPKVEATSFDLQLILEEAVSSWRQKTRSSKPAYEFEFQGNGIDRPIVADATQIRVAVDAIIKNAVQAMSGGGRVVVACRLAEGQDRTRATCSKLESDPDQFKSLRPDSHLEELPFVIEISDTGPGLSDKVQRHMFDPFYSPLQANRGLGFGLSKAWRIATLHGGAVEIESVPGEGATVRILLPDGKTV